MLRAGSRDTGGWLALVGGSSMRFKFAINTKVLSKKILLKKSLPVCGSQFFEIHPLHPWVIAYSSVYLKIGRI